MSDIDHLKLELISAGNASTKATVRLIARDRGTRIVRNDQLRARVRVADAGTYAAATDAIVAPVTGNSETLATVTSDKDLILGAIAKAKATGTFTFSGVAKHAEQIVIGERTYRLTSLANDTSVSAGQWLVDISGHVVKSQGTLTIDAQPTAGDTMTIGSRVYTFRAAGTADESGEIDLGANLTGTQANILSTLAGTDGLNTVHLDVTAGAWASDDLILTAKVGGTPGNTIATTETFTAETNVFDATTLGTTTAGTDASLANAATALRAAINADPSSQVVASGSAGAVVATAIDFGAVYNAIATTDTAANGAWGAVTLAGGANDLLGEFTFQVHTVASGGETVRLWAGDAPVGGNGASAETPLDVVLVEYTA